MNRMKTILLLLLMLVGWSTWCQSGRVKVVTDEYDNSHSGSPATTKQAMLDSLAGIQSFPNRSELVNVSPPVGYLLEDRQSGRRYKVIEDTIVGVPIDSNFLIPIPGGKYLVKLGTHTFSISNANIAESFTQHIAKYTNNFTFHLWIDQPQNFGLSLPPADSVAVGTTIQILITDQTLLGDYYLTAKPELLELGNATHADSLFLEHGESFRLIQQNGAWRIDLDRPDEVVLSSYEAFFKRRFHAGQSIYFNGNKYEVTTVPGIKGLTGLLSVDSTFVIPVKEKAPWSWNRISSSSSPDNWVGNSGGTEYFTTSLSSSVSGMDGKPVVQITDGPVDTDNILQFGTNLTGVEIGDKVTFSFSYMLGRSAHNNNIRLIARPANLSRIEEAPDTLLIDTTRREMNRYQVTWTVKNNSSTLRPALEIAMDSNDVFYLTDLQWEVGSVQSDLKYTLGGHTPGQLFAILTTDEGAIDFDKVYYRDRYKNNVTKLKAIIAHCALLADCHYSSLTTDQTIDSTLILPEGFGITGRGDRADVSVTIDLPDAAATGIELESDGTYSRHQFLRNLAYDVVNPAAIVIDAREGLRNDFERIRIDGNDQAAIGLKVGRPGGSGAIGSSIFESEFYNLDTAIFYRAAGNIHRLERNFLHNTGTGLAIQGGSMLWLNQNDMESNSQYNINTDGVTSIFMTRNYFEDAPIRINRSFSMSFRENRMSGVGGENTLYLEDVEGAVISSNRFYQSFKLDLNAAPYLTFSNNAFEIDSDLNDLYFRYRDHKKITLQNNYTEAGSGPGRNSLHRLYSWESLLKNTALKEETYLSGKLKVSNFSLENLQENLFAYSDSIGPDSTYSHWTLINDTLATPAGLLVADVIAVHTTVGGTQAQTIKLLSDTIRAGESAVIQYKVKALSEDPKVWLRFRDNNGVSYDGGKTPNQSWTEYDILIDSAANDITSFDIRLGGLVAGDSVAITDFQVNKGPHPLGYIRTTGEGLQSKDTVLSINESNIVLPNYGQSNKTAAALTKTYSGYQAGYANDGTLIELPNNWGTTTGTTDAGGDIIITHGLSSGGAGIAPDNVKITNLDLSGSRYFTVHNINATTFTVRVFDGATDGALNTGAVNLQWEAKAKAE